MQLAERARAHMAEHRLNQTAMADALGVDKATLSRSLATSSFSQRVRSKLIGLVDLEVDGRPVEELLRKSLHILERSNKLRTRAEAMLMLAIDRASEER